MGARSKDPEKSGSGFKILRFKHFLSSLDISGFTQNFKTGWFQTTPLQLGLKMNEIHKKYLMI
jgi:hypothetical protein